MLLGIEVELVGSNTGEMCGDSQRHAVTPSEMTKIAKDKMRRTCRS